MGTQTSFAASRSSAFPTAYSPDTRPGSGGVSNVDVSVAVTHSGDDSEWDTVSFTGDGTTVSVGHDGMMMGTHSLFRFQNVNIAQGKTIVTAVLKLIVGANASSSFDTEVKAEDVDSSVRLASSFDIDAVAETTASVTWTTSGSWTTGTTVSSPEIKTVIQEIVDRSGWAANAELSLHLKYAGDELSTEYQRFKTYDDSSANAAVLEITYTP